MNKGSILFRLIPVFFFLLILSSCNNSFQKLLKSDDYELKLSKAKEYYNKGTYTKALPLIEELISVYKGTKDTEKLYYYYAYCYFGQGDYLLSSYYFKYFLDFYPRSLLVEDARYMIAYSYYKMSPEPSLEQDNTERAIESFEAFTNAFPYSDKLAKCNELIDELRGKLEVKAFNSAELYYKLKNYKASATAFNNLLSDFPETRRKEEIIFYIIKSYFLLAENSIPSKMEERYELTVSNYLTLVDRYPESVNIKEAERMYITSNDKLNKIRNHE